jgi:hypothetical protein
MFRSVKLRIVATDSRVRVYEMDFYEGATCNFKLAGKVFCAADRDTQCLTMAGYYSFNTSKFEIRSYNMQFSS